MSNIFMRQLFLQHANNEVFPVFAQVHRSFASMMCNVLPLTSRVITTLDETQRQPFFEFHYLQVGTEQRVVNCHKTCCHFPPKQPGMLSTLTAYFIGNSKKSTAQLFDPKVLTAFFRSNLARSTHQVAWP